MEALIFSISENLIKHIIDSKLFSKISILFYAEKIPVLNNEIIRQIDKIDICLSRDEFAKKLKSYSPLTRCISFGCAYIFKEEDISYFDFPILNFHTGKIPENRGKTPLFWDIVKNEKFSYGTLHAIDSDIDMGIVLDTVKIVINDIDTPRTLAEKLINQLINNQFLIKWIRSSKKEILKQKITLSKGAYMKSFSVSTNYLSSELKLEYINKLWRCYSIWGKIKINGKYYSDISLEETKITTRLITSDQKYFYGIELK